jgi:hypothetical protein
MGRLQGVGDRRADGDDFPDRPWTVGVQLLAQRPARDVLHHDVGPVAVGPGVEDRDDVGVGEPGRRRGLAQEAGADGGVGGELRMQELHRHRPVENPVVSQVDLAHTAGAEQPPQLIPAGDQAGPSRYPGGRVTRWGHVHHQRSPRAACRGRRWREEVPLTELGLDREAGMLWRSSTDGGKETKRPHPRPDCPAHRV